MRTKAWMTALLLAGAGLMLVLSALVVWQRWRWR